MDVAPRRTRPITHETGVERALRGLVFLSLAALVAGLVGCSAYPDPYTGICPEVDDLEVSAITSTTARIRWRTITHLTQDYLRIQTDRAPERIHRGTERVSEHDVTLEDLIPGAPYQVIVVKDLGGQGDFEDIPTPCGSEVGIRFRTAGSDGTPGGLILPDPTTDINPSNPDAPQLN